MIDFKLWFYNIELLFFLLDFNIVIFDNGDKFIYEYFVVVFGIKVDFNSIKGFYDVFFNLDLGVFFIYGYDMCDKVDCIIKVFKGG